MCEGLTVFEELIRMGDLKSDIWHDNYLEQLENSNEFKNDDYIIGKKIVFSHNIHVE